MNKIIVYILLLIVPLTSHLNAITISRHAYVSSFQSNNTYWIAYEYYTWQAGNIMDCIRLREFWDDERTPGENDQDYILRMVKELKVPDGSSWVAFKDADAPPWCFRKAWVIKNHKLTVDMDRARMIKMEQLRAMRDVALQELDIEFNKAYERSLNSDDIIVIEIAMQSDEKPQTKRNDNVGYDNAPSLREIAELRKQLREMPETFKLNAYKTAEELRWAVPPYLESIFDRLNSIGEILNLDQQAFPTFWDFIVQNDLDESYNYESLLLDRELVLLARRACQNWAGNYSH